MLAKFIEDQTGVASECRQEISPAESSQVADSRKPFFLWDCLSNNLPKFWAMCSQRAENGNGPCLALINAPHESALELQALRNGADGLFRECDPPDMLIKGIAAILRGDLWYSREVLSRFVRDERKVRPQPSQSADSSTLTPREREVLERIAAGASNDEIAKNLYISPSTVKTHAYNIYAKIRVPNRIQAALWAVQNL